MGAAAAPVSEEQALEIIRRTDHVFTGSDFIRKQFPKEVISLDFLNEMLGVLLAFPYLNFIAAITGEPPGHGRESHRPCASPARASRSSSRANLTSLNGSGRNIWNIRPCTAARIPVSISVIAAKSSTMCQRTGRI